MLPPGQVLVALWAQWALIVRKSAYARHSSLSLRRFSLDLIPKESHTCDACRALLAVCLVSVAACDKGQPAAGPASKPSSPLKIAYSDWPGWVAWEIAIQKGWFKEEGVPVDLSGSTT